MMVGFRIGIIGPPPLRITEKSLKTQEHPSLITNTCSLMQTEHLSCARQTSAGHKHMKGTAVNSAQGHLTQAGPGGLVFKHGFLPREE